MAASSVSQGTSCRSDWEIKRWRDTLWPPQALDKHSGGLPFTIIHFQRDGLLVCLVWQVVLVIWMSLTVAKSPGMCRKKGLPDTEDVLQLIMQLEKSRFWHFPSHVTFLISVNKIMFAFKYFFFKVQLGDVVYNYSQGQQRLRLCCLSFDCLNASCT